MSDFSRILVAEQSVPQLFSAMFGPLRIGERGGAGHPVEVATAEHGVELIPTEPIEANALRGDVALWWSVGDARMEFTASVRADGEELLIVLSGSPKRVQERSHRRVRVEVPLWVHRLGARAVFEAVTSNLSVGGLAFTVEDRLAAAALEVGTAVVVVPRLETGPIGAAGTIVRANSAQSYSVAFTALGAAEESRIASAISTAESRYLR